MAKATINGVTYEGDKIEMIDGKLYVDGELVNTILSGSGVSIGSIDGGTISGLPTSIAPDKSADKKTN